MPMKMMGMKMKKNPTVRSNDDRVKSFLRGVCAGRVMRRGLVLALSLLAAVLVSACTDVTLTDDNNPSAALRQFCACISDGDYGAAFALTGNTVDVSASDLDNSLEGLMLGTMIRSIRIEEITDVTVNVVTARQKLSVTHLDMRLVVKDVLAEVMEETREYEWKHGSYKTDEEIAAAVEEILRARLEGDMSACVTTEWIQMEYRFANGRWHPVMSGELYDALTGHAAEATGSVTEFFEAYRSARSSQSSE